MTTAANTVSVPPAYLGLPAGQPDAATVYRALDFIASGIPSVTAGANVTTRVLPQEVPGLTDWFEYAILVASTGSCALLGSGLHVKLSRPDPAAITRSIVPTDHFNDFVEQAHIQRLRERLGSIASPQDQWGELLRLADLGDASVPPFLVHELGRVHKNLGWKAILILATERVQFENDAYRGIVKARLRESVTEYCKMPAQQWQPVVWSAIRCYASMLAPEEVPTLAEYLRLDGNIETCCVTLQAIQNVFFQAPAPARPSLEGLRAGVSQIATEAFAREEPEAGDQAALAQESVFALAALGDSRLPEFIHRTVQWGQPWFAWQVRETLEEMLSRWMAPPTSLPSDHPAVTQIAEGIRTLRAHDVEA
jgi:hypothetical protein